MLTAMEWSVAHHSYVHDDTKVSVDKMRQDAQERAFDKRHPEHTVIHFHSYSPDQGWCFQDGEHEQYRAGKGRVA